MPRIFRITKAHPPSFLCECLNFHVVNAFGKRIDVKFEAEKDEPTPASSSYLTYSPQHAPKMNFQRIGNANFIIRDSRQEREA